MPYDFQPRPPRLLLWGLFVIWIFATVTMLGTGIDCCYENHRFATESVRTTGHVDAKFERVSMGRFGGMHYQRSLLYSYSVGGVSYTNGIKLVAGSTWGQFKEHDAIPVAYLRNAPGDSRLDLPAEAAFYSRAPWVSIPLGLLLLFAGGVATAQNTGRSLKKFQ